MTIENALAVAATGWGLLMGIAPGLQIRRMFQTQSSRDVSLGYLGLLTPGFVLWLAYGASIGNGPVMITNTVSLTFMLITIGIAWSFRRRAAADGAAGVKPAASPR
jgi:MtN3 and saliva related transmembrane protein